MELNSIRTNKHISVASSWPGQQWVILWILCVRLGWWMWPGNKTRDHTNCVQLVTSQWPALTRSRAGVRTNIGGAGAYGNSRPDSRHRDMKRERRERFFFDCLASHHSPCKWATLFLTLKCWRASIPSDWHPLLAHLGCCLWGQSIHLGWTYISLYHEQNKWVLYNIFGKNAAGLFLINYDTEISQIVN